MPSNNIMNVNPNNFWIKNVISYAPGFVIGIISIFCVPKLVDNLLKILSIVISHCANSNNMDSKFTSNRSYFVLYFRSIITLFIPLIATILLLPRCGNNWTLFWIECDSEKYFANEKTIPFGSHFSYHPTVLLSSYDSICKPNDFKSILTDSKQLSQCVESFLDMWTPIICVKLLMYTITIWIAYISKKYTSYDTFVTISNLFNTCRICNCKCQQSSLIGCYIKWRSGQCCNCCQCCCDDNYTKNRTHNNDRGSMDELIIKCETIPFDYEYASLATKLELFFIFMPLIPFILPIVVLALYSNYLVFSKVTQDLKWQFASKIIDQQTLHLKTLQNAKFWQRFPFKPLYCSLIFGQMLFISNVYVMFHQWLNVLLVVVIFLMDVVCIGFSLCHT